jgi:hypothetical protein
VIFSLTGWTSREGALKGGIGYDGERDEGLAPFGEDPKGAWKPEGKGLRLAERAIGVGHASIKR